MVGSPEFVEPPTVTTTRILRRGWIAFGSMDIVIPLEHEDLLFRERRGLKTEVEVRSENTLTRRRQFLEEDLGVDAAS